MFESLKKKFQSLIGKKTKKKEKSKEDIKKISKKTLKKKNKSEDKLKPKNLHKQSEDNLEINEKIGKSEKIITAEQVESEEITSKEEGFFSKLKKTLTLSILKQEQFNEIFSDLEITLLENNVSLSAVDKIRESLSKNLVGISLKKSEIDKTILTSLKTAITSVLIEPPKISEIIKSIESSKEPYVILFFGINGSGKTTSIAKLANLLKNKKISCVLTAGDTFRAASIEQLEIHANNLSIPLIKSDYGADPASVSHDAISYAKKNKIQCVLIDTAGRMYTSTNLMKEMEKIIRVSNPNLKIFVGESIAGNDATQQAKIFDEHFGIDGIILSKADIDKKAGTILSVSQATNKPIYFLGNGQNYSDLQPFSKKTVLENLGLE